jgi:hypothetical protein
MNFWDLDRVRILWCGVVNLNRSGWGRSFRHFVCVVLLVRATESELVSLVHNLLVRPPGFGPGFPRLPGRQLRGLGSPCHRPGYPPNPLRAGTGPRPSGVSISHSQRPATTTAKPAIPMLRIKASRTDMPFTSGDRKGNDAFRLGFA